MLPNLAKKYGSRAEMWSPFFSPILSLRASIAEAHLSLDSVLLSHAIGRVDAGMISWGSLLDLWQDITTFLGEVSYAMSWSCRKVYWNRRNYSNKTDDAEEKQRRMFANTYHSACEQCGDYARWQKIGGTLRNISKTRQNQKMHRQKRKSLLSMQRPKSLVAKKNWARVIWSLSRCPPGEVEHFPKRTKTLRLTTTWGVRTPNAHRKCRPCKKSCWHSCRDGVI